MAITEVESSTLYIKIDDGTGAFAHSCMMNTDSGINFTNNLNERLIPDCDNPGSPDKSNNRATSQAIEATGAGVYDQGSAKFFIDWWKNADKKSVKVEIGVVGGERVTGNALLSSLNVSAPKDGLITSDMTIVIDTDGFTTETIT